MKAPPHDRRSRIVELVGLYRRTRYDVTLPEGSVATLCVGEPAPPMLAWWIGSDKFAVYLTACNPYSIALTDVQNETRVARMRKRLCALGACWLEGSASDANGTWVEPSLLVSGMPASACDELAFDFEQNASLGVDTRGRARLRIYRSDWRDVLEGAPDLDWISR